MNSDQIFVNTNIANPLSAFKFRIISASRKNPASPLHNDDITCVFVALFLIISRRVNKKVFLVAYKRVCDKRAKVWYVEVG